MPIVIPPWLHGTDVLGSLQAGSHVGLQARAADQRDAEMAMQAELAAQRDRQNAQEASERLRYNRDSLEQARDLALRDDAAKANALKSSENRSAAELLLKAHDSDALSLYRSGVLKNQADKLSAPQTHYNDRTGEVSQLDPTTNALSILRQQGPMNMVTTATRGKMEQQEGDLMGAYDIAKRLNQKLDAPGPITGAAGLLRRGANMGLGTVGFDDSNPSDEAMVLANQFNAKMVRALRSDSNISKDERNQLMAGLPDPSKWFQGTGKVRGRLSEYLQTSLDSVRENASKRGAQIPAQFMSKDEVLDAFKAGKLTKDDVVKWKSNNIWDLLNDLNLKSSF